MDLSCALSLKSGQEFVPLEMPPDTISLNGDGPLILAFDFYVWMKEARKAVPEIEMNYSFSLKGNGAVLTRGLGRAIADQKGRVLLSFDVPASKTLLELEAEIAYVGIKPIEDAEFSLDIPVEKT